MIDLSKPVYWYYNIEITKRIGVFYEGAQPQYYYMIGNDEAWDLDGTPAGDYSPLTNVPPEPADQKQDAPDNWQYIVEDWKKAEQMWNEHELEYKSRITALEGMVRELVWEIEFWRQQNGREHIGSTLLDRAKNLVP